MIKKIIVSNPKQIYINHLSVHLELLGLTCCWNAAVTRINSSKWDRSIFVGGCQKKWVFVIIERIKICTKSTTLLIQIFFFSNQDIYNAENIYSVAVNTKRVKVWDRVQRSSRPGSRYWND